MPPLQTGDGHDGRSTPEGRRAPTAAVLRSKLALQDLDVDGKRVLVRADFNVPIDDGHVTDDTRIRATLPTLRHLRRAGAAMIVVSHRGRPEGQRDEALSMASVAGALGERLGVAVAGADDCVGPSASAAVEALEPGGVLLLENLRFHGGETANDPAFAAALAAHADVFVNDAFGVSHRAHASVVGVAETGIRSAAGDVLQREVSTLSRVLVNPPLPFVMVLGGAKVKDKVGVVGNLLPLLDTIIIGGAIANAFLAARGHPIGGSLVPAEAIGQARRLLDTAADAAVEVLLPVDLVAAPGLDRPDAAHVVTEVADDEMALDIGPTTVDRFVAALADAGTVVWNGPMGVFEVAAFAAGSYAIAQAIATIDSDGFTVVGGGDTAAVAAMAGISQRVSHISTGGGASLDLLSGAILPGVAALTDKYSL